MELPFQQVATTHTNEECEGNYWDFLMSQVKILPSKSFMGNSSLENILFQVQKPQRRFTGDFKKRAAPPASRTASMPELSSENIIHISSLNNQNANDRFGYSEGLNQYYSGSTKCTSNLNYTDIPFTTHAQRIQDSPSCRAANVEIAFSASIEKVRIKDPCIQRKEYITLVTTDTVKYCQLPKRSIVAIYIIDENHGNNKAAVHYTEDEKVNVPFSSVPIQSIKNNRLSTKNENQVVQGLSEEAGNSAKSFFSLPHSHFRALKSEYASPSKVKEKIPSSVISLTIREEARKEHSCASPICLQHAQAERFHQPLKNQNLSLSNTPHTALSTTPVEESILGSTKHFRKGKVLTKSRKGFSSITITARRIISAANKLSEPTVSAPTHEENAAEHGRSVNVLKKFKSPEDTVHIPSHTDNVNEFPCNGYTATEECSEPRSVLHSTEDRPSSLKIDSRYPETLLLSNNEDKIHLAQQLHAVVSFAHFKVPSQCFNSTYYLDKSLLVDLDPLTNNNRSGLIQKSSLSLKLSCTSSKSSADGGNSTFKLISFIGSSKQKVTFTMLDKKSQDVSLRASDFIQQQTSTAQKVCKTERQSNGHPPSGIKDSPSLPEGSAHLFISLSNMNKGTNGAITEQKYKRHQHKVQCPFSDLIRESDMKFPNCHVGLNRKRNDTVNQGSQKPTLSVTARSTTGSPTVHRGEDIEINQSEPITGPEKTVLQVLTLREALETYKPDFISRSQKRIQQLEFKAQQRRVQLPEQQRKRMGLPIQNLPLSSPIKKRQCTVPHPLSDNLFKPRERIIPEKEMQMRSKRIYNKLPEVKRKKEEEKKKFVSQTNRLRAELFKKKLLDQILQRNNDCVQESS
ncbi:(E2-independent) E3 ubiquitin-conjugating enzyme FATS isoform X2 [Heptranchias perlo]|uniref:(E2-independent) E3 ubiquitin-conjugating enzyme FATS isoform X2 n=1 Tax=Heptranchias perlo TaxID=212740 RepID=UPI00355A6DBE